MAVNDEKVKKLVGLLIEVLHGENSDTRDLAVVQLAILGEKAVPYVSSYLEAEAEKENEMIQYFEMYLDWKALNSKASQDEREYTLIFISAWDSDKAKEKIHLQEVWEKSLQQAREAEIRWNKFAAVIVDKYRIRDIYFNSLSDESPEYFAGKIEDECGGKPRRWAIEGILKALSIIGDQTVIPLLQRLPVYQFPYEDELIKPVFEKAKETIEIIQNSQQ